MNYKEKVIALLNSQELTKEQKEKLERIFPELKESEGERIRKELLEHCRKQAEMYNTLLTAKEYSKVQSWIAWIEKQDKNNMGISEATKQELEDNLHKALEKETPESCNEFLEKQVEQKPADKIKPKFKIGDWVVYDHRPYQVIELPEEGYINLGLRGNGKLEFAPSTYCRHWTIQDAKDGDVLANDHHILILKELDYNWGDDGTPSAVKAYCGIKPNGNFEIGKDNWSFCGTLHIHPATKEQRDLLFAKIKEAGYEWDAEKKELKKIEQEQDVNIQINPSEYINDMGGNGCYLKNTVQSSAWSEEDETKIKSIIALLKSPALCAMFGNKGIIDENIKYLKSLRDRVQPQSK